MCIFARCGCGKIVAGTVRLFVTQCKGMLTACVTLKLPLSFLLSNITNLMASGCGCCPSSSRPARMGRKHIPTRTYIQTRLVVQLGICIHLTTHVRFTWSSLTKNASNTLLLTGSFERGADIPNRILCEFGKSCLAMPDSYYRRL